MSTDSDAFDAGGHAQEGSSHPPSGNGPASTRRTRVVVVDDHQLFRTGVITELGDAVEVVGQADDVETAIEVVTATEPDVVLLDVHLPSGSGATVIEAVKHAQPAVAFLALSVSDAPEDVLALVRAGARGYVTKSIEGPELVGAIGKVAEGDTFFSPRLAGFVLDAFARAPRAPVDPELDLLTPREQEVMQLLARGYAYKEIARELYISLKTVESHASAVLRKLQLSNRHELTRWAAQRGVF
jgi:DNA-binding NarL/FixJ family response regulator